MNVDHQSVDAPAIARIVGGRSIHAVPQSDFVGGDGLDGSDFLVVVVGEFVFT